MRRIAGRSRHIWMKARASAPTGTTAMWWLWATWAIPSATAAVCCRARRKRWRRRARARELTAASAAGTGPRLVRRPRRMDRVVARREAVIELAFHQERIVRRRRQRIEEDIVAVRSDVLPKTGCEIVVGAADIRRVELAVAADRAETVRARHARQLIDVDSGGRQRKRAHKNGERHRKTRPSIQLRPCPGRRF